MYLSIYLLSNIYFSFCFRAEQGRTFYLSTSVKLTFLVKESTRLCVEVWYKHSRGVQLLDFAIIFESKVFTISNEIRFKLLHETYSVFSKANSIRNTLPQNVSRKLRETKLENLIIDKN